ncbi:hypothetical protein EVAR_41829_1 [Eumeta japonica]|uniref:Uncharacterized protein n=1 Tax=Eumeta variegata TaxID=151549 RepID=A0A4C1XCP2_EUMVA|nr:hypothetical protein EVAR_41829_1 [Eumeta japonica]
MIVALLLVTLFLCDVTSNLDSTRFVLGGGALLRPQRSLVGASNIIENVVLGGLRAAGAVSDDVASADGRAGLHRRRRSLTRGRGDPRHLLVRHFVYKTCALFPRPPPGRGARGAALRFLVSLK